MSIEHTGKKKEICWNITSRCNQKCRYCHRFLGVDELDMQSNKRILGYLIRNNINEISWTGGEPLLYPNIENLLKEAYKNNIKNNLITNASLFDVAKINKIARFLTSLTLSIDSLKDDVNSKIGRGTDHVLNIVSVLNEMIKYPDVKIRINSVASMYSLESLVQLTDVLKKYKIKHWRIFRFMDLREIAIINNSKFEISDEQFLAIKKEVSARTKDYGCFVEFKEKENMEKEYVLIIANGDIITTTGGKDLRLGTALDEKMVAKYLGSSNN